MLELDPIFAEGGALASAVAGFRARPFQLDMARAVASAIADRSVLVAEAGTGTGKTFAYLVPALRCGGKVIISTGTKTLQDQLFDRDIPKVRSALKLPVSVALLKGRANYVCHHHLQRALADGRFANREDVRDLGSVERFARTTLTGDRAECSGVSETAPIWTQVTSTRENCLGSECRHFDSCFVMKARKQALEADVVVVNHHLFFADVVLRDEGIGELLPACNTVIFDEAHQIPETATLFFGESTSTAQLVTLVRDTVLESASAAKDSRSLPDAAHALEKAARDIRLAFPEESGRMPMRVVERNREFQDALARVLSRLDALSCELQEHAARSEGLQRCHERVLALAEQTERWRSGVDGERVKWIELFTHSLHLNSTPLSVADIFAKQVQGKACAWVFTSATLSVARDFQHYCKALGLSDARTNSWDSPFLYDLQALLYVPSKMPEPNTPEYTRAVINAALPLIEASGGRAFLLFTSLRAMRESLGLLHDAFQARRLDFPVLMQGQGSRTELLERFRELGNAVLIGSQSFWEGVDVKGEALSLVVIDKLPFSAPDDPVLAARIDKLNQEGRNAFLEHQLPQAVITLKQGAGRLIRDENDRGVLMICDPRLYSKSYGRRILQSLPPMRRTRLEADAVAFFRGELPAATVSKSAANVG
ncbi:MAG: putative ATP-dependent helicase DinG [Betaproteobacteria bacterium]|nr:putative ATP-dependent helicase DinG [Betaproteobacteria bacterium]